MAFWNDISRFAGNLTGGLIGESDEERKRKEALKQQAKQQARAQAVASTQPKPAGTAATTTRQGFNTPTTQQQKTAPTMLGVSKDTTDVLKTPQQRLKEAMDERLKKQVRADGTVVDTRPMPLQVPGDAVEQANKALKEGQGVQDIGNYYRSDADALRKELAKPNPNQQIVAGLTTSIKNRKGEIERMNSSMSRDEREQVAAENMKKRGGKFESGRNFATDLVGGVVKSIVDTVGAPGATIGALKNEDIINKQLADLNARYKRGEITEGRLREEYGNLTDGVIGNKTKVTKDGIRRATAAEDIARFGGQFAEAGVNAYVGGGTGIQAAARTGEQIVKQSVASIMKNALVNGAKESAITGTIQTGADVAQDRGVTPQSLLANYGFDFGLNVAGEAIGPLVKKLVTKESVDATTQAVNQALREQGSNEVVTPQQVEQHMTDEIVAQAGQGRKADEQPAAQPEAAPAPFIRDPNTQVTKNLIRDADGNLVRTDTGEIISEAPTRPVEQPGFDNRIPREEVAPAPERKPAGMSQDSEQLLNQVEEVFKHEYNVEYHDRQLEAERLKEQILDPNTPEEDLPMLAQEITEHRQRMDELQRLMSEDKTPPEAPDAGPAPFAAPTPEKTITDSDGNLVDTQTGEILFDPATDLAAVRDMEAKDGPNLQEVSTSGIADATNALPSSKDATADNIPAIQQTMAGTNAHLDNFAAATTPEQRANLMKEIAEHERSGAAISDDARALYDQWIGPVVDSLYDKSRRAGDMGRKDYYLPEELAGTPAPEVKKFGNTWADEANMEFGHSKQRQNKIDTDELNDPVDALKNYVQQFYQDNYGHLTPENLAEAEARGAGDPSKYVTGRRAVAEKLDESMVRSITDRKKGMSNRDRVKDTLAIAADIRDNFDASTPDPASITTFKGGLSGTHYVRTNRKVASRIEAGNGLSVYERFGLRQFENAESFGNHAFSENFHEGITPEEFAASVHGYYDQIYQRDYSEVMSPERFHEIVAGGVERAYRTESGAPLAKVEQNLAAEQAIWATEHIRYADKATQKYVDYEVGHVLRRGKMPSTIARTVANQITRTFYSGALGLNPLSAIQNLTELSRVAGLTATEDTLKTLGNQIKGATPAQIKKTFKEYGIDSNRIRQETSDALPSSKKLVRAIGKVRDAAEDTVMAAFNATEATKNYGMIKALEIKHQGIADPRLRREAIMDDFNANSLIGGHYGNLVGVDRSNAARVAMQFGTYTIRDWGQLADKAKAGDVGYVARTLGVKAALAVPMYTLFGTSLAYSLGINEFKGGPAVSLTTELINSIVEENDRVAAETEEGKKAEFDWNNVKSQFSKKAAPLMVMGGNYLFNKLGVQAAAGVDKDGEYLRTDTFIGDQQRGYNQNKNGLPRFAAAENPMSVMRGILGGAYNTDEAREYFGKDFWAKPQLFGLFDTNNQQHSPAYGRFQDRIEAQSKVLTDPNATKQQKDVARATIRNTFDKAYESQDLKNDFFKSNPEAASVYKEMTKTTFNKETGKRETDVISPEKWKYVDSEKSGKLFDYLKNRAEQNHKNFGDPIDPIYTADLTEAQRKEVLNLRSSYTGDDKERKSMLYETEWYNQFAAQMSDYYDQMKTQTFSEDSDYGKTKRAQEYFDLSTKRPQRSNLYKQYQALRYGDSKTGKAGDDAAGKQFYKNHADQLNADNESFKKADFEWTNKMRVLEGATPLAWEQFTNDTYGYKSGGSGGGYRNYGSGSGSSKESAKTGVDDTITRFGGKTTGPKKLKLTAPELVDVTKVVKQPRATRKAPFRITI